MAVKNNENSHLPKLVEIFSFAFWIPYVLLALVFASLAHESTQGTSGTEYIGILLTPISVVVGIIGLIYLFLLIRYTRSSYPSRKQKTLSLLVILFLISSNLLPIFAIINGPRKSISSEKALNLIKSCRVESIWNVSGKVTIELHNYESYRTSSDNWKDLVSEVEKLEPKCGNINVID